ncbi:MAG: NAD(+)/NADH kinase, partial [Candidatus Woesearchaeota archaeon]|nr:NAD(+)/NADH kinase [Candidatus Woesearchaeota archaeon]
GMFPKADIFTRDDFNKEKARNYDLIISIGGDNHFQAIGHYVGEIPILGVNSDNMTSTGALLKFIPQDMKRYANRILRRKLTYEKWIKARAHLNDRLVEDAVAVFSLSNIEDDMMTRYKLKIEGKSEVQKSSGILVTTGAGSTGWYKDAGIFLPLIVTGFYKQPTLPFAPKEKRLMTLTREPYDGKECVYRMMNLMISEGEELEFIYWANENAKLSSDSVMRYVVSEGDRIRFSVSPDVLNVVTLDKI